MGRYGFDFAFDASSTVRGGEDTSLGMHFFGNYFGSDDETSTEDAAYEVFFYVYDSNGDRFPSSPGTYSSQVTALIAGTQVVAILDTLSGEALNKNATLNLTTVFTITTSGGTAIGTAPTVASTISGGAYNQALPMTGITYRIDTLAEGDNTVSAYYKDANGDEYTSDNTIAIRFASTAPIIEIDGVDVINPISTTEFEVDVTYLYGGSLLFDAGEQVTDTGETLYYGGTEVIVPDYALLPAANNVQVIAETDDFGQSFNTTIQLVTKIPAIINNGLTTIDEETFGTTYAATGILDIDTGAPYQVLGATPTEAPYTFTSMDYKVYNFTASYTYPATVVSNSVVYDITYQEFAFIPFEIKIFDYTTDEFLFLDDQDNATPLIEPNGHPTGTMILTHKSSPDYVDIDQPYYHAAESLENFKQVPSQGLIDPIPVPQLNYGLTVSAGKGTYLSGGLATNLFKPEQVWSESGYFYGTGTYYVCGRQGTTASNGTSLQADDGNLVVKIGGTDYGSAIAYDTSLVHYFRWQNWFDGANWVDSLLLDETTVYTQRSTARGTNTNSLLPTIGCIWNVDTEVDPATDAQQGEGGSYSAFRFNTTEWSDKQTSSLYYRYFRHLLFCMGGDSITEGVNSSGQPWWVQEKENGERYEYNVSYVCTARGGSEAARSLPTTPIGDWTAKPPWQTVVDPHVMQTCEYVRDTFDPELYVDAFGYNDISASYNVENPNAGVDSTPSSLGWDSYADMLYWMAKSKKNWYDVNSIEYYSVQAFANSNTSLRYDSVERRDMARFVNDLMIANATGDEDDFLIFAWYETRETGTNNADPSFVTDGVHYNVVGSTAIRDTIVAKTELDKRFEVTRDNNFIPIIKYIDPVLDGTVLSTPYDIVYRGDGEETTVSTALTEGSNLITKQHTNSQGVTGQKTSDVTFSTVPPFDGFTYDMTGVVGSEFVDTSGNGLNATVLGTEDFTGSLWNLVAANQDYCYTLGTETDMATDEEWSHSVWTDPSSTPSGSKVLFGKLSDNSFGNATALYIESGVFKSIAYGAFLTGPAIASGVEKLIGWQNRYDSGGATWYLDTYVDGALVDSTSTRNGGSNTLPVIIGAAIESTTDPAAASDREYQGTMRDYKYERIALTTPQWLARFNAGPLP